MWGCRVGDNALGRGTRLGKPETDPEMHSRWCASCTLAEFTTCGILQYAPCSETGFTLFTLSDIRAHLPDWEAVLEKLFDSLHLISEQFTNPIQKGSETKLFLESLPFRKLLSENSYNYSCELRLGGMLLFIVISPLVKSTLSHTYTKNNFLIMHFKIIYESVNWMYCFHV